MVRSVRFLMLVGVSGAAVALCGCVAWSGVQRVSVPVNYPHAAGESMTLSVADHYQFVARSSAHDARALVDDLDLLFLTERPTRLTRWHVR